MTSKRTTHPEEIIPVPAQPYSHLIRQLSALTAEVESPDEFTRAAARYLAQAFDVIRVSLSIQPASNGPVAYSEVSAPAGVRPRPRFLFSRTIAIRGVEYGRLEIESGNPVKDAVLALETVAQLVGLYAEERRLVEANTALADELKLLEQALATSKVVARASGVVPT
jgi:hypothetical protein